ncbi:MAG TPA: PH domain-containing protein [Candidatus Methylomirabilis sp.]|nr:PH domain-containing protein [Candidatus Methylomirabilis sp.]
MFKLEHVLLLKEDESVRGITKRHGLALLPGLGLALLLIVAPFFFLFPLFRTGPAGVVVFSVVVLVGIFVAVRSFVMWDGDVFIVTDLRIVDVDQKGLFSRTVSEVKLTDIQDVSWSKSGLIDAVFNVGNLKIQTSSGALVIEAAFIPRPQDLHSLVNDLRHAGRSSVTDAAMTDKLASDAAKRAATPQRIEVLKRVASHLEALGDDDLAKLDRTLKQDERDITIKKLFGNGTDDELKPIKDPS